MFSHSRTETPLFSWIHISDIHMGHGNATETWDQTLVLDRLAADIKDQIEHQAVPHPDAILITGDVAFSGDARPDRSGRNTEYNNAAVWLSDIAQHSQLKPNDIFVIPGNHDVQRSTDKDRSATRLIASIRSGTEQIDDALENAADSALLAGRFANFHSFSKAFGAWEQAPGAKGLIGYKRFQPHGAKICVIGFQTALVCSDDHDRGKLQLGKRQLVEAFVHNKCAKDEIVIVLTHHPLRGGWLMDERDSDDYISTYSHIHLCGHVHDPESEDTRHGSGKSLVRITAGAAHGEQGGAPTAHGYNFAGIFEKRDGNLELRIWPRRWSQRHPRFVLDTDGLQSGEIFATHALRITHVPQQDSEQHDHASLISAASHPARPLIAPLRPAFDSHCDSPPNSPVWVGREAELALLNDPSMKVLAITGIGGQGKSVLAARYLSIANVSGTNWDWRDCREVGDTLQTQVLRIIERASAGTIRGVDLSGADPVAIASALFETLGQRRWILVFDNVDHYIDIDACKTTLLLEVIVKIALTTQHCSQIVLTCRPSLTHDDEGFVQVALTGLSLAEAIDLFRVKRVHVADPRISTCIAAAHAATEGHPLWLNLIATQVSRRVENFDSLIAGIEAGRNSKLPVAMLQSVWKTLSDKQRQVLRSMAEAVRPETEERLRDYSDLSFNQFTKVMKTLQSLDLIVTKSAPLAPITYELHPLIRSFVRTTFSSNERSKFINRIARAFDRLISTFKPELRHGAAFAILHHWVLRAELAMNAGRYSEALAFVHEVHTQLLSSGYNGEFVRIASRLLSELDWTEAVSKEYRHFDDVVSALVTTMACMDRYVEAEALVARFEKTVSSTGARYVGLCKMKAHMLWSQGRFEAAKEWARRGLDLTEHAKLDTQHECAHELALALRDSGEVDAALELFLKNERLDAVISISSPAEERDGTFYGNIGRCLSLKTRSNDALIAYRKSALLLESDDDVHVIMNLGWVRFWIAEVLEQTGELDLAYCFYREAASAWRIVSPSRSRSALDAAQRLVTSNALPSAQLSEGHMRAECRRWLHS
jgi:tetratricopeptide (TPR) repeat protein